MTAQEIVETTVPLIEGSRVSKEKDYTTLLTYLNFAKSKLARDTQMWIGGESIVMTTAKEYTLSTIPLQIIEIYDSNLNVRPRNSIEYLGYTQTAPNKIYVNNPSAGLTLNINWFEEPANYKLTDIVYIPNDLIEAMQHYIAYKVFSVYKSQNEEIKTKTHLEQYKMLVDEYIARTDMPDIESINQIDLIYQKGLV